MPIEEVLNDSTTILPGLIIELGKVGKWIQALGLVIILWLIFQIIALINNRIRRKRLGSINDRLDKIEKKIDKIIKKIKNKK